MKGAGFERAQDSKNGFAVESGVNKEGQVYARVYVGGNDPISIGLEDGWTMVRLLAEALAVAEADSLVYKFGKRMGDDEMATKMILAMREERERQDLSMEKTHFYKTITEGKSG